MRRSLHLLIVPVFMAMALLCPAELPAQTTIEVLRIDTIRSHRLGLGFMREDLQRLASARSAQETAESRALRIAGDTRQSAARRRDARNEAVRARQQIDRIDRQRDEIQRDVRGLHSMELTIISGWDGVKREHIDFFVRERGVVSPQTPPGTLIEVESRRTRLRAIRSGRTIAQYLTTSDSLPLILNLATATRVIRRPPDNWRPYREMEQYMPMRRLASITNTADFRADFTTLSAVGQHPDDVPTDVWLHVTTGDHRIASLTMHIWALDASGNRAEQLTGRDGLGEGSAVGVREFTVAFDPGRRFAHGFEVEFSDVTVYIDP